MRTPLAAVEVVTHVRGSRFRARLEPARTADAAAEALAARSSAHPDATHHCWAYRLWESGHVEGVGFDAGEPSGTAGRPILGSLESADVIQAVCVVSRWFGGTKLGTGGLARAYGEAAGESVRAAARQDALRVVSERAAYAVGFDYPLSGAVKRVASRFAAREAGSDYGARVELELTVPAARAEAFRRALVEATGGAVETRRLPSRLESE